jgi:hypothetical protein
MPCRFGIFRETVQRLGDHPHGAQKSTFLRIHINLLMIIETFDCGFQVNALQLFARHSAGSDTPLPGDPGAHQIAFVYTPATYDARDGKGSYPCVSQPQKVS